MEKVEILKKIRKVLSEFKEIQLGYVYGSFLTRDDFEDIDIAIECKNPGEEVSKIKNEVTSSLWKAYSWQRKPKRISWDDFYKSPIFEQEPYDVHLLSECPINLQYRIISEGRCIYMKDRIFKTRYEAEVIDSYLDFNPLYREYDKAIFKRVEVNLKKANLLK